MSDQEAIQGLWKVQSLRSKGTDVGHGDTHWEFKGSQMQEIIPSFVDGGQWAAFALDETARPKRIDKTYLFERDGETVERVFKECYELTGDTLRIGGSQIFGQYPPAIDETFSNVTTLVRDKGPRPATKKASGTAPVESAVLGTVMWNDDMTVWQGKVLLAPEQIVSIMLEPQESDGDQTIARGEALIQWVKGNEADARAYAADEMTDLAEDWRDEDEEADEITPEAFADRITLSEISLGSDGSAMLWYNDDNIFAGHVVVVSVNADRQFTEAQMMG